MTTSSQPNDSDSRLVVRRTWFVDVLRACVPPAAVGALCVWNHVSALWHGRRADSRTDLILVPFTLFLLYAPFVSIAAVRTRVRPDGIEWFSLRGRQFVAWDEIEDGAVTSHSMVVISTRGRHVFRHYFTDHRAVAATIREHLRPGRGALIGREDHDRPRPR